MAVSSTSEHAVMYQMLIHGQERWHTLAGAAQEFNNGGMSQVSYGEKVKTNLGNMREMSETDRQAIAAEAANTAKYYIATY